MHGRVSILPDAHFRNWHFASVRCGAAFRPLLNELRKGLGVDWQGGL